MGIAFDHVGKGKIVSLARYRAKFEAEHLCADAAAYADAMTPLSPAMKPAAPVPRRIVEGFAGQSTIYDAEGRMLFTARSDLIERCVEAVNEVEGRIET